MKFKMIQVLRYVVIAIIFWMLQPAGVSAHDFGGSSILGDPPGTTKAGGKGGGGQAGPLNKGNKWGGNVYLYDGSEYLSATDLALRGVLPIVISRSYNSQSTYDSAIGYGWDFSYHIRLFTYADSSVTIRWTTGFKKRFVFSGGGYVNEDGSPGSLVQNGDGTFTFTGQQGGTWQFDLDGKLTRIEDNHGNSLRMSHSADKKPLIGLSPFTVNPVNPQIVSYDYQLARVEEWDATNTFSGRYVEFNYDGATGRLLSISDFTGRTISYQHDAKGNLVRVNYPQGLYNEYAYEDPNDTHNVTAFKRGYDTNDPKVLFTNEYDDQDRVIKQYHGNGILEVAYTIPLTRTTITKTVKDDSDTTLHQFTSIIEFDSMGYVTKFIDADKNAYETIRDVQGNPIRTIVWKNTGTVTSPVLVEERVFNRTYDADGNLTSTSTTLDSGEIISGTYTYDHGWLQTWSLASSFDPGIVHRGEHQFEYNGVYPKLISQRSILIDQEGTPNYETVTMNYNTSGQLTSVMYPNGDQETYTYTNEHLTNSNGILLGRDALGNITSITDPNNHQKRYEYDQLGRITKIINALGEETVYRYTGHDLTEVETGISGGNPGQKWHMVYDDLGRMIGYSVDLDGTPIMQQIYTYDSDGNLLKLTNALDQSWTYTYDEYNRITKIKDPSANEVQYFYDILNRPVQLTDANGEEAYYTYDDLSRLIEVIDARNRSTRYSYDALNNLTKMVDAENKTTTFGYDNRGFLVWKKSPAGQTKFYQYDTKGRLAAVVDAAGTRINYEYTNRDMVSRITFSADPARIISFNYDAADNLVSYTDSAFSTSPMHTWTYDSLDRVDTIAHAGVNKVLDYDYTRFGRREKLTCLSGGNEIFSYHYNFDNAGQLISLTEQPLNKTTNFSYDIEGRVTAKNYANGAKAITDFKSNGLVDRLRFQKSDATNFNDYQYTYDMMGNISSLTSLDGTSTFGYDPIYQLLSADFPAATGLSDETYTYDGNGNRLTGNAVGDWTYDEDDQLISYDGYTFTYDNRGNQIASTVGGSTTQYTHDDLDALTSITAAGLTANYTYGLLNKRIKKEVNGVTTWYIYDGNKLLAEFDASGDLIRHYAHYPGAEELLTMTVGGSNFSVMTDYVGSPVLILDESEVPVWQANYQVFGEAVIDEDPDNNAINFTCNQRFPGQYHDAESGLYYNLVRYYSSQTGRYLQRDPVGGTHTLPLTHNRYIYAVNSPMAIIDPLGLAARRLGPAARRNTVIVLTNSDLYNIFKEVAEKLKKIPRDPAFWRYAQSYGNPWAARGGHQNDVLWDHAVDFDSWLFTGDGYYAPTESTLFTIEGDPKGRVFKGWEINYMAQGMLYQHIRMDRSAMRNIPYYWKTYWHGKPEDAPTAIFWTLQGAKWYDHIMNEHSRHPKWDRPNIQNMRHLDLRIHKYLKLPKPVEPDVIPESLEESEDSPCPGKGGGGGVLD